MASGHACRHYEHIFVGLPLFGQAKKRTQKLPVADCTTLNGNVTRTGDIREKRISKSAPCRKINVRNDRNFAYFAYFARPTSKKASKDGVETLNSPKLGVIGLAGPTRTPKKGRLGEEVVVQKPKQIDDF